MNGPEIKSVTMKLCSAALLLFLMAGWPGPATADAQISEAWSRASTVDVSGRPISARLQAMGSLEASVEEPQDRITPWGFSDNPAGLRTDQDSSTIDQSSHYDRFMDGLYAESHSVVQRRSGFVAALRNTRGWVLGLEGIYGGLNASRHDFFPSPDNGRFIRDFDVLYPANFDAPSGDIPIGASVSAPRIGLTYGRKFFHGIDLAGRLRYRHETESRSVPNPYEINLTSTELALALGALVRPHVGSARFTVSASGGWTGNHVRGLSDGPFNNDQYDWDRPQVHYDAQVGVRYKSLRGIIDGRHLSHDGEETAEINWAPQYFLNPLPINVNNPVEGVFKAKWSALLSGIRRNEVASRWMLDVPGTPAHVGIRYRYYRELEWVHPNTTVLTSARLLDVRRLGYDASGGVSLDLPGRKGLIATEAHFTREGRQDFTGVLPEISSSEASFHFGGEYRALSWLPLRGGFVMIRRDPDREDAYPALKGVRLTAGVGYFWDFLDTQIDAAFAHEHVRYTPGDPSVEIERTDQASIVFRYAF